MIHSTKFDKATIARSRVTRRKGNRVRFFDPTTARMSGWHKVAAPAKAVPDYAQMTVPVLRDIARDRGLFRTAHVNMKTRKADLVSALIANN